jgi:hypothetical protein
MDFFLNLLPESYNILNNAEITRYIFYTFSYNTDYFQSFWLDIPENKKSQSYYTFPYGMLMVYSWLILRDRILSSDGLAFQDP